MLKHKLGKQLWKCQTIPIPKYKGAILPWLERKSSKWPQREITLIRTSYKSHL